MSKEVRTRDFAGELDDATDRVDAAEEVSTAPDTVLASAGVRVRAVVTGVSNHEETPRFNLSNSSRDAREVHRVLEAGGAVVHRFREDSTKALFKEQLQWLGRGFASQEDESLPPGHPPPVTIGLFYFAGHGVEIGGENVLIGSNIRLKDDSGKPFSVEKVREQCIGLSEVIEALNNGRYDLSIVLLDCCRSRASATLSSSIGSSGSLAAVAGKALTAKHGGVVFCAAQTGRKADDNFSSASVVEDDDQHGPFAAALLAHLLQPGVAIGPALVTVRDSVKTLTKGRQVPSAESFTLSAMASGLCLIQERPRPPPWSLLVTASKDGSLKLSRLADGTEIEQLVDQHAEYHKMRRAASHITRRFQEQLSADPNYWSARVAHLGGGLVVVVNSCEKRPRMQVWDTTTRDVILSDEEDGGRWSSRCLALCPIGNLAVAAAFGQSVAVMRFDVEQKTVKYVREEKETSDTRKGRRSSADVLCLCPLTAKPSAAPLGSQGEAGSQQQLAFLAAGDEDGMVRIFAVADSHLKLVCEALVEPPAEQDPDEKNTPPWQVRGIAGLGFGRFATGSSGGSVRVWDCAPALAAALSGTALLPAAAGPQLLFTVAAAHDGKAVNGLVACSAVAGVPRLASVGGDSCLRLWKIEAETGALRPSGEPRSHGQYIAQQVQVAGPNGDWLASTAGKHVWLCDVSAEGRPPTPVTNMKLGVISFAPIFDACVAPSANSSGLLASCDNANRLTVWRCRDGRKLFELEGHRASSEIRMVISAGNGLIATGDDNGVVALWHASSGVLVREVLTDKSDALCLAAMPKTRVLPALQRGGGGLDLIVVSGHGSASGACLWDFDNGSAIATLGEAVLFSMCTVDMAAGGLLLACGTKTGVVELWDPSSRRRLFDLVDTLAGQTRVTALADAGAGRLFSAQSEHVCLWDCSSGALLARVREVSLGDFTVRSGAHYVFSACSLGENLLAVSGGASYLWAKHAHIKEQLNGLCLLSIQKPTPPVVEHGGAGDGGDACGDGEESEEEPRSPRADPANELPLRLVQIPVEWQEIDRWAQKEPGEAGGAAKGGGSDASLLNHGAGGDDGSSSSDDDDDDQLRAGDKEKEEDAPPQGPQWRRCYMPHAHYVITALKVRSPANAGKVTIATASLDGTLRVWDADTTLPTQPVPLLPAEETRYMSCPDIAADSFTFRLQRALGGDVDSDEMEGYQIRRAAVVL